MPEFDQSILHFGPSASIIFFQNLHENKISREQLHGQLFTLPWWIITKFNNLYTPWSASIINNRKTKRNLYIMTIFIFHRNTYGLCYILVQLSNLWPPLLAIWRSHILLSRQIRLSTECVRLERSRSSVTVHSRDSSPAGIFVPILWIFSVNVKKDAKHQRERQAH
jgi:hypothetical protein